MSYTVVAGTGVPRSQLLMQLLHTAYPSVLYSKTDMDYQSPCHMHLGELLGLGCEPLRSPSICLAVSIIVIHASASWFRQSRLPCGRVHRGRSPQFAIVLRSPPCVL
jgi:hypothetical protein